MKSPKTITMFALFAATCLSVASQANAASTDDFVKKATMGNQFEILSSQVALEKSQNPDVKAFAKQMIDDHGKARNALKSAVSSSEVDPLDTAEVLDSKHQKALDKLKAASGKTFDKEYIAAQKDAHAEAVSLFKQYAKSGTNATIKGFAKETLPTLEEHQKHVKQLKA